MKKGRPQGSSNIPWEAIVARCVEQPNTWLLPIELAAVSLRTVQVIRRRERRALRLSHGKIYCRVKGKLKLGDAEVCTLFVRYQPTKES